MKILFYFILGVLFLFVTGCQNHYEKGLALIMEKDFKAAELEFSKLTPEDENYLKAGDCVNYIWACTAFNENRYPVASKYIGNMKYLYESKIKYNKKLLGTEQNNLEKPNEIEEFILSDVSFKIDRLKEIQMKEWEKITGEHFRETLKNNKKEASMDDALNDIKIVK